MYSMAILAKPYLVRLEGATELAPHQRIQVEVRFATALEAIYEGDVARIMVDIESNGPVLRAAIEKASCDALRGVAAFDAAFHVQVSPEHVGHS
jgi:hypothetical protein